MADHDVEVAIIGAGTAGMRAYREAVKRTQSVRLIEAGPYGTTCARVGCMPSKLLIAGAEAAQAGKHAGEFGVRYAPPEIDGRAVMHRVREERDRFVGFVLEAVEKWPPEHRITAMAQFVSENELKLDTGDRVRAKRIVIATGSRPHVPENFASLGDRVMTSDDIFDWTDLPDSVAVFGGGIVGLELGQALAQLGVRTNVFGRGGSVGPLKDPKVLEAARTALTNAFSFQPDATVIRVDRSGDEVVIEYETDSGTVTEQFDHALVATGRRANVEDLGLEHTGLPLDKHGVPIYDPKTGQCGKSPIFIAGDANAHMPLLHVAADEGQAAGYNAANFPDIRRFEPRAPISIVFTSPQIMMVGQSHAELSASGIAFECGEIDWTGQGRARAMAVNEGLLRVYGERITGKFLGAEMVGPRAEHIAHLLAWSLQSGLTVGVMIDMPFYHPVIEEGVRSALRHLNYVLKLGPEPPPRCIDCGPGG